MINKILCHATPYRINKLLTVYETNNIGKLRRVWVCDTNKIIFPEIMYTILISLCTMCAIDVCAIEANSARRVDCPRRAHWQLLSYGFL